MTAGQLPLGSLLGVVKDAVLGLIRAAAVAGIVMAAADYFVVRRRTNKQLRMTKEEVKQENKNAEGDPQVKAQIRARQMAMARNRQMADVPTADVVLVNPTHVAVALRYEPTKGAPRVIAKGQGEIATKIRELAVEHRRPDGAGRAAGPGAARQLRGRRGDPGRVLRRGGQGAGVRDESEGTRIGGGAASQPELGPCCGITPDLGDFLTSDA